MRTKMNFNFVISGEGDFDKKFHEALNRCPHKNVDLVRAIGSALMLAFEWSQKDNVSFDSFKAGKIEEVQPPIQENIDK